MENFEAARLAGLMHLQQRNGIGTLKERSLHAILKYWFEPDEQFHEQRLKGCVVDIYKEPRVVEIQTRGFSSLCPKLDKLLPQYQVTVVHPIAWHKQVIWVTPESGETTPPRKSPKTGKMWDAIGELYRIRPYLGNPQLTVVLVLLDMEEYRLLDGWSRDGKKGAHRIERIPTAVGDIWQLSSSEDYSKLLPSGLPYPFTTMDYAKATRLSRRRAGEAVNILYTLGAIIRTGKKGNAFLYDRQNGG